MMREPKLLSRLFWLLLIWGGSQYLSGTAQSGSEQRALLNRFETLASDAVSSAPSTETKPGGWLFD